MRKIRLVEVMPFIATWKNDPNWRSGMKKSAERSTISSTPASGNAAPLAYCPDRYAHAGRGTPVCDDVHGGERAQLNLQNIHGHYAELFRLLAHFLGGMRIRVKSFQRFKTLYIVKKHRLPCRCIFPNIF